MKHILLLFLAVILIPVSANSQRRKQKAETPKVILNDSLYSGLKWRNIGPFRGGRSVTSTGVVGQPMTYYMGSVGGGIYKTTDDGITWKNITDGQLKTGTVGAIAVAESNPNIVVAGMGEHAARGVMTSMGDGVYKSTDAGKTWKHIGLDETRHISDVIINPSNPDIIFVSAQGAQYGPEVLLLEFINLQMAELHGSNLRKGFQKNLVKLAFRFLEPILILFFQLLKLKVIKVAYIKVLMQAKNGLR